MSTTLGIHVGHDGGAAIIRDSEVLIATSEERHTRFKYSNGWWNSVRCCLEDSDLCLSDIDLVVFSNAGIPLDSRFDGGLSRWSSAPLKTCVVDHHLSHAIGGFAMSGFSRGIVSVTDAGGNQNVTQSAYLFSSRGWECVLRSESHRERCRGLGTTYEAFTNFLGFRDQESGKTMALAAYGNPTRWKMPIFSVETSGEIVSDLRFPHYWGVLEWAKRHNLELGKHFSCTKTELAQDVAAYIQHNFENALLDSIDEVVGRNDENCIVISGGTGLNCIANSRLKRRRPQLEFYFSPLCSDVGLPLGNALYGQWLTDGILPSLKNISLYLGPRYNNTQIQMALDRHPDTIPPGAIRLGDLHYYTSHTPWIEAAQMIADGQVVGWWQGRSELGPRALGARSILANATMPEVRSVVNRTIKEREWFRPFGPSFLSNSVDEYLEDPGEYKYMIEAPPVTSRGKDVLRACVHVDGTTRAQTVHHKEECPFYKLLAELERLTGHGALLNTSFNIDEPIVESPGDAIASFLRSQLDALILENVVCRKGIARH